MNTDFQRSSNNWANRPKRSGRKQEAEKTSKNKNRIWIFHKQSDKSPH
ncbi:Uncharacterised protein [Neisseria gonorrhoeae]|uniref:Uncharacterized protein n=1 Tax=Neisseria gonorrhoeae TaxID=485 RepID=A0A378VVX7_NEIGO|nr:Uncharacterised protein [Neisseria gonorrhoeae]